MPSTQNTSARFVAITTLCKLEQTKKPVNKLFASVLATLPLKSNDRQLASNIIFGLLRNRETLDTMLHHLCNKPLKKFDPFVLEALRVGLFQIMYLDRIPESAAVNESVKAVQAAHLPKRLHGFVNAVLRNSIRKKKELLKLTENPARPIRNHPKWLYERWRKQFGEQEADRICLENGRQTTLCLQINSISTDPDTFQRLLHSENITCHRGRHCTNSIILEDLHTKVSDLPGYQEGWFQVQDQGAQLLTQLMTPLVPGGTYLDACAGVGGKTSLLIQLAHSVQARVYAVEPDQSRQKLFRENMARLHQGQVTQLFSETLQNFAVSSDIQFDGILLDAPCSGTGVIRRHPDIRWNRRPEDLHRYQKIQLELLYTAATLLKPNGRLVYATCSLEDLENQQVIRSFLADNSNFTLDDCSPVLPESARPLVDKHCFKPLPQPEIDGFFGARLTKTG